MAEKKAQFKLRENWLAIAASVFKGKIAKVVAHRNSGFTNTLCLVFEKGQKLRPRFIKAEWLAAIAIDDRRVGTKERIERLRQEFRAFPIKKLVPNWRNEIELICQKGLFSTSLLNPTEVESWLDYNFHDYEINGNALYYRRISEHLKSGAKQSRAEEKACFETMALYHFFHLAGRKIEKLVVSRQRKSTAGLGFG